MPNKGQPFPDFTLPTQDGQPLTLADLRGKKVIIFAFPKANTTGCTAQACGFRDSFPQLNVSNAVVLGLSPDAQKDLKKWKEKEGLGYELLSDVDKVLLTTLGVWQEKSMYGRKYMGVVRSHWVIDEHGNVLDEQIKVSPEESVKRALAAL